VHNGKGSSQFAVALASAAIARHALVIIGAGPIAAAAARSINGFVLQTAESREAMRNDLVAKF
jgi:hypothetical protein